MDANKSVTAHFKPDVTLTLAKQGVGDVNPVEGTYTFIRDHVASVSASPANGFDHWEGDLEEDDDPGNPMQVVELTQSKSLTAVFKPMYTLTMAREGEGGTVSPALQHLSPIDRPRWLCYPATAAGRPALKWEVRARTAGGRRH